MKVLHGAAEADHRWISRSRRSQEPDAFIVEFASRVPRAADHAVAMGLLRKYLVENLESDDEWRSAGTRIHAAEQHDRPRGDSM